MKKTFLFLLSATPLLFTSCSDDDAPAYVNEDEVITTVTATFTPVGGGTPIVLKSRDADGDGPTAPVITVSGSFIAAAGYNGVVTFTNELTSPVTDITNEIEEEGTEHQLFFRQSGLGTFAYTDADDNGRPVGLQFLYTATNVAATGNLIITLRHQPDKAANGVSGGDITNAGGSTDAEVQFPVTVVVP